jgi:hypothetical protein
VTSRRALAAANQVTVPLLDLPGAAEPPASADLETPAQLAGEPQPVPHSTIRAVALLRELGFIVIAPDEEPPRCERNCHQQPATEEQPMSRRAQRLLCIADCRVGMRVRHIMTVGKSRGAGDGEIMAIGPDGVLVHYATGVNGLYDARWFEVTGAILERVSTEAER